MHGWLEAVVVWIVAQVQAWGYGGIFVMMAIESSFVPFPSEVALIPAGYLASQGLMDPYLATVTGVAGSLVGAFVNYGLALLLGRSFLEWLGRFERWVPFGDGGLLRAERYFADHGEITTFVGRLIPGVRQLISVPAGVARMNIPRFSFYTGLGAGLWSTVLVVIGYLAGDTEEHWRPLLHDATLWILGGIALLLAGYIWHHRRSRRAA